MFAATQSPLHANGTVTIGPYETFRAQNITGSVFSDQGGTLKVEQSFDNQNWDISSSITVTGGQGQGFSFPVEAPYFRATYTNGGVDQTVFRLFIRSFQSGNT